MAHLSDDVMEEIVSEIDPQDQNFSVHDIVMQCCSTNAQNEEHSNA